MEITYAIQGMHCEACIDKIKAALSPVGSVISLTLTPPRVTLAMEKPLSLEQLNAQLGKAGNYQLHAVSDATAPGETTFMKTYYPIFLIAGFITIVTLINNISVQGVNVSGWMSQFMAGFFLVFSAFKLLDVRGFAEGYATYDLLAKRWHTYGLIYPFLELGLGLLYLLQWLPTMAQVLTIVLMGFSILGVLQALAKKQAIRCACLGTVLNVPISSITLIEDGLMVVMAAMMLIMGHA